MEKNAASTTRGDCQTPIEVALLRDPLDFIHEEHFREREVCAKLDLIAASDRVDGAEVSSVLAFLCNELPLHFRDEEEGLFPLLQSRSDPEDEVDKAIARLTKDHANAGVATPRVIEILQKLESGETALTEEEKSTLKTYAEHERRHMIFENAVILPLARALLTETDIESLRILMRRRRGLEDLS